MIKLRMVEADRSDDSGYAKLQPVMCHKKNDRRNIRKLNVIELCMEKKTKRGNLLA